MIFTEQTATELIQKHNLSPGTFRVWKTRGTIPERYAGEAIPKKITKENELQQARNIISACQTGKFNIAALCRLADVDKQHLYDVIDGDYNFNDVTLMALKKAINTIRNNVKKVLSLVGNGAVPESAKKEIKKLLGRTELSWSAIIDNKSIFEKFFAFKNKEKSAFPESEINHFKSALLVFLTETGI